MKIATVSLGVIAIALAGPALAAPTYGDLASWQAAVGSYSRDTIYGSELSSISSLTLDSGPSMTFSTPLNIRDVPSSWATWSGGYGDQVLWTQGATSLTTTFTSGPVGALGFFAEPNSGDLDITMTLSDGSMLTQTVNFSGGADFFGWSAGSIVSYSVTSSGDFAIGDFYYGDATDAVPEPATWAMMIAGFGAVGGALRTRRRRSLVPA